MDTDVVVMLVDGQLVAQLPDGRALADADAERLAELLLNAGVSVEQVQMPDWRDGDGAPLVGQKAALFSRMRA